MKKIIPILLLLTLLTGCAGFEMPNIAELLTSPTPIPVDTATPQPTVTLIPTRDLFAVLTGTPKPTNESGEVSIDAGGTPLSLPTFTPIPLPTFSKEFINDMSSTTFLNETVGFTGILYSAATMYWGEGACQTRSIKVTAFVENPDRTAHVFLFMRLRDKKNTLDVGEWNAGSEMIKIENGSFNYNVEPFHLRRYSNYKNAWIEYELVSVNEKLEILGRTKLFDRNLSLAKCGL